MDIAGLAPRKDWYLPRPKDTTPPLHPRFRFCYLYNITSILAAKLHIWRWTLEFWRGRHSGGPEATVQHHIMPAVFELLQSARDLRQKSRYNSILKKACAIITMKMSCQNQNKIKPLIMTQSHSQAVSVNKLDKFLSQFHNFHSFADSMVQARNGSD